MEIRFGSHLGASEDSSEESPEEDAFLRVRTAAFESRFHNEGGGAEIRTVLAGAKNDEKGNSSTAKARAAAKAASQGAKGFAVA